MENEMVNKNMHDGKDKVNNLKMCSLLSSLTTDSSNEKSVWKLKYLNITMRMSEIVGTQVRGNEMQFFLKHSIVNVGVL